MPETLEALIRRRVDFLTAYQNAGYAKRYQERVAKIRDAEAALGTGDALSRAVAKYLFKLMAYKDEYEVARLYTDGEFEKRLNAAFEGDLKVSYNLAPPLFAKRDAKGHLIKARYGAWVRPAFRVLAALKGLRGTALDVFGHTHERKQERALLRDYEALVDELPASLSQRNLQTAIKLASLPESIRGYGHIKEASLAKAAEQREALLRQFKTDGVSMAA